MSTAAHPLSGLPSTSITRARTRSSRTIMPESTPSRGCLTPAPCAFEGEGRFASPPGKPTLVLAPPKSGCRAGPGQFPVLSVPDLSRKAGSVGDHARPFAGHGCKLRFGRAHLLAPWWARPSSRGLAGSGGTTSRLMAVVWCSRQWNGISPLTGENRIAHPASLWWPSPCGEGHHSCF